jgi:hypothetical protein
LNTKTFAAITESKVRLFRDPDGRYAIAIVAVLSGGADPDEFVMECDLVGAAQIADAIRKMIEFAEASIKQAGGHTDAD